MSSIVMRGRSRRTTRVARATLQVNPGDVALSMRRIACLTLSWLLYAPGLPAVQGPPRPPVPAPSAIPPRDTSAAPRGSGVATLVGHVVAGDTGKPLRGATVSVTPVGGGDGRVQVSTRVGDDGRYALHEIPAGEYWLIARHPAYISQSYGQTTPRTPERRVNVATGATQMGPFDFVMVRGAAIAGRVVDEVGQPVERVEVRAAKLRRFGREWHLIPHGDSAQTDDRGEYRLHGLPPGEYIVSGEPPRPPSVTASGGAEDAVAPDLTRTWAPATVNPAEATRVRLEPGGEGQADVQLASAVLATIAGHAVDAGGRPVMGGSVRLLARGGITGLAAGTASVGDDGAFTLAGVAPGAYTLVVQPRPSNVSDPHTGELAPIEVGVQHIDVSGASMPDVVVRTTSGATIRGRLIVDGDPGPLIRRSTYVIATPTESDAPVQQSARARVQPDLSFQLLGVRGRVRLRIAGGPEGWWTRAVRVGATDVTEEIDADRAALTDGVELVVSTRPGAVRGVVTSAEGAPVDAIVLLFTQDAAQWDVSPNAARTTLIRALPDGRFESSTVRPGPYYAVGLRTNEVRSDDLGDPDYLRTLVPHATRVDLSEGQIPELTLVVP